ncbi:MAG: hypothetical protein KF858_01310 [Candidatus Sumerlaeia bacterium]|nr:hypothetical protein [Candidatus Sumerlaeia bacterium]
MNLFQALILHYYLIAFALGYFLAKRVADGPPSVGGLLGIGALYLLRTLYFRWLDRVCKREGACARCEKGHYLVEAGTSYFWECVVFRRSFEECPCGKRYVKKRLGLLGCVLCVEEEDGTVRPYLEKKGPFRRWEPAESATPDRQE